MSLAVLSFGIVLGLFARHPWQSVLDGLSAGFVLGVAYMRAIEWRHGRWFR